MMNVSRAKSRSLAFFFLVFFLYFGLLTPSFGCRLVIFFFFTLFTQCLYFLLALFFSCIFLFFFFCILQSNTTSTTTANSSNENKLTYCFVPCGNNEWLDFFFLAFGHNQSVRYIVWGIFVHTKIGYPVSNPLYRHIVYTVVSERL